MKIRKVDFKTYAKYDKKDNIPEFAFVGRSNSGKSTLINALLKRKIARTSKKPGCTRFVNIIRVNDEIDIVDLPGYGFAKVGKGEKKRFSKMIEEYFTKTKNLKTVFIITDIVVGPKPLDFAMIDYLISLGINFVILLNKADKIPKNKLKARENEIRRMLGNYPYITISAEKKQNLDKIYSYFTQS